MYGVLEKLNSNFEEVVSTISVLGIINQKLL